MKQSVGLQINSLAALERLLGGDSELEVNLRQSVVAEFTKKYLKSIVATPYITEKTEEIKKEIGEQIDQLIFKNKRTESNTFITHRILTDSAKELVKNEAEKVLREYLDSYLQSRVQTVIEDRINQLINKKVEEKIEDAYRTGINAGIDKIKQATKQIEHWRKE